MEKKNTHTQKKYNPMQIQSISHDVPGMKCVYCLCAIPLFSSFFLGFITSTLQSNWFLSEQLLKEIGFRMRNFGSEAILKHYDLQTIVDGSLQTILLWIVGKLAGGGTMAVTVGPSDML